MKTKLLTAVIAAFSLVVALFPSRSQAVGYEYSTPTWEQVGYFYGYYLGVASGGGYEYGGEVDADLMLNGLYDTYGPNVAYYYYFSAISQNLYSAVYEEAYVTNAYVQYLAYYYGYLYYYSPSYAEALFVYFQDYLNTQWGYYNSYVDSITLYYDDAADYYYDVIFPNGQNYYYN